MFISDTDGVTSQWAHHGQTVDVTLHEYYSNANHLIQIMNREAFVTSLRWEYAVPEKVLFPHISNK